MPVIKNGSPGCASCPRKNRLSGKTRQNVKYKNNCETRYDWLQEWTTPSQLCMKDNLALREIVPGPFISPKLLKTSAIITTLPYTEQNAILTIRKKAIRRGIPDPWAECLALEGFCSKRSCHILKKNFVPCCTRLRLTKAIWNDLRLPLVQGIPDPSRSYIHPLKHKKTCNKVDFRRKRNKDLFVKPTKIVSCNHDRRQNVLHKKIRKISDHKEDNKFKVSAKQTPRNFITIKVDSPPAYKKYKSTQTSGLNMDKYEKKVICNNYHRICNGQRTNNICMSHVYNGMTALRHENVKEHEETLSFINKKQKDPKNVTSGEKLMLVCCRCGCPYLRIFEKHKDLRCFKDPGNREFVNHNNHPKQANVQSRGETREVTRKSGKLCCDCESNEIRNPRRRSKRSSYSNASQGTVGSQIGTLDSAHGSKSRFNNDKSNTLENKVRANNLAPKRKTLAEIIREIRSTDEPAKDSICFSCESTSNESGCTEVKDSCPFGLLSKEIKFAQSVASDSGEYGDVSDTSTDNDTCVTLTSICSDLLNNGTTLIAGSSRRRRRDKHRK